MKLLYTVILFGLIGVLFREFYLVWFDDRIFVGHFNVITEGEGESSENPDFASRIVSAQAVLSQQLLDYQRVGEPSLLTDSTYNIAERDRISLPDDALKGIEITIQNINLSQIFTAVRKGFSSPNEIYGYVTNTKGSVIAAVDWPRAPDSKEKGAGRLNRFYVPAQPNLLATAKYVACSMSWARGSAIDRQVARIRSQFCDFAMALGDLYELKEKASAPAGLSDEETIRVRRRTDALASHSSSDNFIPDIYRLRADLIDLLPDKSRTLNDLVQAQEDRLSYAMLSPRISNLPAEQQRYTVLALARPAIPLPAGKLRDLPDNWKNLLTRYSANIEKAVQSTALVVIKSDQKNSDGDDRMPAGTAFIVAPNLAVTARHVIDAARKGKAGQNATVDNLELCFGDNRNACTDTLKISKIHFAEMEQETGSKGRTDVALVEVDDHSPVHHPPLTLAGPDPAPNTFVGAYAFVIGYPFIDPRLPPPFIDMLIGKSEGVRRVIPGRILAFNVSERRYISDISTTGGTSGGPLVDLASGSVLALSFAGEWRGGRGKFAYALQFPQKVRDMIERRQRGEAVLDPEAGKSFDANSLKSDPPPGSGKDDSGSKGTTIDSPKRDAE